MTLTAERYADLADMWDGGAWTGVKGGSKFTSKARQPMREWLAAEQGGMCPVIARTGEVHPLEHPEFNHVMSARTGRTKAEPLGFKDGNIFAGCAECNTWCEREYGFAVIDDEGKARRNGGCIPFTALAADLIPTTLPSITGLLRSLGLK